VLKHIRITTADEKEFRATAFRLKFGTFSGPQLTVRKVKPRWTIRVLSVSDYLDSLSTHCRRTFYYKISSFGLELWE